MQVSPLWVCHDANVPLGVWHKCFYVNTIYSKILFIFKIRLPQCLKNIFKTLFIIPEKSSSFWLEAPTKLVITVRNLRMGHWLRIWWSGSKDLSSQFGWAKGGTFPWPFSGKMNSLKIKHLKRFIFLVPEYGNLTGVKTYRDRLKNSGKAFWNEEFKFWFWKG